MANAKKILITTETSEIFILRVNRQRAVTGFCAGCAAETELLTLDEAVSVSSRTALELIEGMRSGAVHYIETPSGHLLICLNSAGAEDRGQRQKIGESYEDH